MSNFELFARVFMVGTRVEYMPGDGARSGEYITVKEFRVMPVVKGQDEDGHKSYWDYIGLYRWQSWTMGGWEWRPNETEPEYNRPSQKWIEEHVPDLPSWDGLQIMRWVY